VLKDQILSLSRAVVKNQIFLSRAVSGKKSDPLPSRAVSGEKSESPPLQGP
jgi:hypothetical protein